MQIDPLSPTGFDSSFPMYNWFYPVSASLTQNSVIQALARIGRHGIHNRAIYVHIPFCHSICSFCPFVRSINNSDEEIEEYVSSLLKEIQLKGRYPNLSEVPIRAVFFGGGSPSVLKPDQLLRIGKTLRDCFNLSSVEEWSFETAIADVSKTRLDAIKEMGVTHLRLGPQTFQDRYRRLFRLTSTYTQIDLAVELVRQRFPYMSFDILYGMNGESIDEVINDLGKAIEFHPQLIDFYPINNLVTQTMLHRLMREEALKPTTALEKYQMTQAGGTYLTSQGYCPHNGHGFVLGGHLYGDNPITDDYSFLYHEYVYGYTDSEVLGFGANALSVTKRFQIQNTANILLYIRALKNDNRLMGQVACIDSKTLAARPIVMRLPYHGRMQKNRVGWRYIPEDTQTRLNTLILNDFIFDTGSELQLTKKGWLQYVNLMYYLSPSYEREALDLIVDKAIQHTGRFITSDELKVVY